MATAIEYGLIAALIAVGGITAVQTLAGDGPFANTQSGKTLTESTSPSAPTHDNSSTEVSVVAAPDWVRYTIGGVEYVRNPGDRCYSIANGAAGPVVKSLSCESMRELADAAG